jgi:electron transport complex protein RnfD
MSEETTRLYVVSSSPHAHSGASVERIMLDVVIAMIPMLIASCFFFGWNAVRLVSACVLACMSSEYLCRKAMGRDMGITDFSAVVTGMLLAFNLPPYLPTWMAVVGSVFAIVVAKQLFGGLGYNPFNPALAARAALLASRSGDMMTWSGIPYPSPDAVTHATTAATPLGQAVEGTASMDTVNYFLGNMNGCIGEVSALAILLGGLYLLYRRVISWHIPVSYLATVAAFAAILNLVDADNNMPALFHLLVGGVMLGAVFMATDMVTSPVTRKGMLIFGVGCGILTMVFRKWSPMPEGVSFAILLMNSVVPLINRATRPRVFGARS